MSIILFLLSNIRLYLYQIIKKKTYYFHFSMLLIHSQKTDIFTFLFLQYIIMHILNTFSAIENNSKTAPKLYIWQSYKEFIFI